MNTYKTIAGFLLMASFVYCLFGHENTPVSAEEKTEPLELPLPTVPNSLVTPRDRAGYVMMHFWDALDATDTVRSLNKDFWEQNFFELHLPLLNRRQRCTAPGSGKHDAAYDPTTGGLPTHGADGT